ncbi:MAG: glycerophosphodiester phosphodiesterase family protein [Stellaceae bacterium]
MATNRPLVIPRVIGHRGAAARAPENTLAGFRRAAELGCAWIEFDVRLSGDNQPIVFHDDTLERLTDGAGPVAQATLRDLMKLDAGGEPIPTLAATLAQLATSRLGANLEMKAEPGREQALAEAVARGVADAPRIDLLVTSFSMPALTAIARIAASLPRGILRERIGPDWRAAAAGIDAAAIACDHRYLTRDQAASVRDAGLPLLTYTVNDPSRAKELFGWGVSAVISDAPDAILAARPD